MKVAILSPDEFDLIMKEWSLAEAETNAAAKAAEKHRLEHGETSDELIDELVASMHQQFQIMARLQAKASGN